jgi:hypothetical protein
MTDIRAMGRADLDEINRRARLWRERTKGKVENGSAGSQGVRRQPGESVLDSNGRWQDVDLPFAEGIEEVSEGGAAG